MDATEAQQLWRANLVGGVNEQLLSVKAKPAGIILLGPPYRCILVRCRVLFEMLRDRGETKVITNYEVDEDSRNRPAANSLHSCLKFTSRVSPTLQKRDLEKSR
ncbi:MAG: hypothetical protein DMG57_33695 [Acidobacteria bacterium]|nr:MAG: hypothetical protein DMG57_33695 [Acidobacteriota bacterium]